MVGPTAADRVGADLVQHLRAVGRAPERELLRGAVPLAVLFAVPGGQLRAPDAAAVWRVVEPVAGLHRAGHPIGLPRHLLLLPPRVLPVVLLVAAGVLGGGRSAPLQR